MPKPNLNEYHQAVQHPSFCFNDLELKNGSFVPGLFNLPKVITGAFAVVFQIKSRNKMYAVRCFIKDVSYVEERYRIIDEYLDKVNLKYFVEFEYIEKGILVNGIWYPIIKMEWIDGLTLDKYIISNISNIKKIENLAQKFKEMARDLKRNNISHCDLHDTNIMIVNEVIKLIDYDAMYVPGLKGYQSNEIGNRNFQHPLRDLYDYGLYVDNFSEWVIYISLLVLGKRPNLWAKLNGGDDCLLFKQEDFNDPHSSLAFSEMEKIPDETIKILINNLKYHSLSFDLHTIPSIIEEPKIIKGEFPEQTIDDVPIQVINLESLEPLVPDKADSSWIWHHKEVVYHDFDDSFRNERVLFFTLIMFCSVNLVGAYYYFITPLTMLASFSIGASILISALSYSYTKNKVVNDKKDVVKEFNMVSSDRSNCLHRINTLLEERTKLYEKSNEHIKKINKIRSNDKEKEKNEITNIRTSALSHTNSIKLKMRNIKKEESSEMARELNKLQRDFLQQRLKQHRVRAAIIPRVGSGRTRQLEQNGIITAADFINISIRYYNYPTGQVFFQLANGSSRYIQGFGPTIASSIKEWRDKLELKYRHQMPRKLKSSDINLVKNKYRKKLQDLTRDERKSQKDSERNVNRIKYRYRKIDNNAILKINDIESDYKDQLKLIEGKYDIFQRELSKINWALNEKKHGLISFEKITFSKYVKEIIAVNQASPQDTEK